MWHWEIIYAIDTVEAFAAECYEKFGSRLFYCSDEFYLKAERALPTEEYYEGYTQIENGVGMITSLSSEVQDELMYFDEYFADFVSKHKNGRRVSIATGEAAYDCVSSLAKKISDMADGRLEVKVYKIINRFFGESITVSGLLTGTDMSEQLVGKELGDELLIPSNTLKADEDIFLDDMTPAQLSEKLGVPVEASTEDGFEFIPNILGLNN